MKEKLETLPLAQLRQIGRDLGIRNVTGQRKAELIGNILEAGKEREEKAKPARAVRQEEARSQQGRQHGQAQQQGPESSLFHIHSPHKSI